MGYSDKYTGSEHNSFAIMCTWVLFEHKTLSEKQKNLKTSPRVNPSKFLKRKLLNLNSLGIGGSCDNLDYVLFPFI